MALIWPIIGASSSVSIRSPVSGKISAANEELEWESATVNEDPYGEGWLAKIEISDPSEVDSLLTADGYEQIIS